MTATETEVTTMTEGGWEDPPVDGSSSPLLLQVLYAACDDGVDIETDSGTMTKCERERER